MTLLGINIGAQVSLDDHPELFPKYQFGAIHTAEIIDCKVTNRALYSAESKIFCRLYLPLKYDVIEFLKANI